MKGPVALAWRRVEWWLTWARRVARLLRRRPDFRRPPFVWVEPVDQPSPRRMAERRKLREEYPLTSGADALGLATWWPHRTVTAERRPGAEDYPLATTAAKYFLMNALQIEIPDDGSSWSSLDALHSVYDRLGSPTLREAWTRDPDAAFAELRVSGPNPMFLRRYDDPARLADEGLETPVPAGSYAVAYDQLFAGLTGASEERQRHFSPGIAIFALRDGRLVPTGIQLRLADGRAHWFPADGTPAWRLAMMHFNSCDMLAHELLAHFMWTHIVAEKFLLATGRNLTWRHPLRRLLAPHLAATLNNNNNATPVLIDRGGLFDRAFGAGERGKLLGLARGEALWHFDLMVPRRHLAERGVLDLPHYPYRDTALGMWDEIETMVTEYVALWYDSDDRLLRDTEAQAWGAELRVFAGPTIPELTDLASLRLVLTAAIFNVVQHGCVNLLQYDTLGYAPAYPVNVRVPVPEDPASVTEATLLAALPSVYETMTVVRATFGFSIQYGSLGSHISRFHWGKSAQVVRAFAARLRARSAKANPAYPPSDPARLGNSVDA